MHHALVPEPYLPVHTLKAAVRGPAHEERLPWCFQHCLIRVVCDVQVIVDNDQARVKDGLPVEAHITAGLSHSNVVRTIAHAWRPLTSHVSASMSVWDSAGSALGPAMCSDGETWLLLELCDRGTLQVCACSSHLFSSDFNPRLRFDVGKHILTSGVLGDLVADHSGTCQYTAALHSAASCRIVRSRSSGAHCLENDSF